ncbi:hypothetical protein KC331_g946 [Hortaea werneckii]|nr:hypothetical protein KC331_g946 [Hortaea werneckii]
MLGPRGWIYGTALLISIGIFYALFAHEPVKTFRETLNLSSSSRPDFTTVDTSAAPLEDGLEPVLGPLRPYKEGFTIASPTYHRTEGLTEYLDNYATGDVPSLHKIILIWNNEEDAPGWLNKTLTKYQVPIVLERRARNSKNYRFQRTPAIETAAVLALDDDMVIKPRDVEYAFQSWQMYRYPRKRMVGYIRRRVSPQGDYRMSPSPEGYSMVLTKSAFIHVDWMDLWWADTPIMRDFRDYVDSRKLPERYPDLTTGCEDIAMSYLYGHYAQTPPLWIAGAEFHDIGHSKLDGISTQEGHNDARQACVHHFREVFGKDSLINTQIHASVIAEEDENAGRVD